MSFGGSQSNSSSQSQSQSYFDPDLKAAFLNNYANAQNVANNNPLQKYAGSFGGDFSGTSLPAAIQAATAQSQFGTGAAKASSVDPMMISTPASVSGAQIAGYMNPYLSQVTGAAAAQLARQNQIDNAGAAAQATAAGAFGGSRSAVLQNLNTDSYQRNLGQTLGNLNYQGYATALGAAQTDLARQLQAAQANQSTSLAAQQSNQSAGLQADIANQNASIGAANVRNASAGLLGQFGVAEQSAQQQALQAAYQEWVRQQNYPFQVQQMLNQSVGTLPSSPISNSSSSSYGDSTSFNVAGLPIGGKGG
jgi:hypothetical protein